jgi:hypothetical protein
MRRLRPQRRQSATTFPFFNYSARVKGSNRQARFFCGLFPFLAPQKNQKNRRNWSKIDQGANWTLG